MADAANIILVGSGLMALILKRLKPSAASLTDHAAGLEDLLRETGAPPAPGGHYVWGAVQHDTGRPVFITDLGHEVELDPTLSAWLEYDPVGVPIGAWDGRAWARLY